MIKKWSNYIAIILLIIVALVFSLFPQTTVDMSKFSTTGMQLDYTVHNDLQLLAELHKTEEPELEFSPFLGKGYIGFKEAIAFKESRGNYRTVNEFGYLGKYQFGAETLRTLGVYDTEAFLHNPELQEKAFHAYAERNKWILRKDIERFVGKKIQGIVITESGILAAAHLAGPGSVKKFLRSYGNETFSDAFGTSVRYYMKKFSGFDTSSIIADKSAKVTL